MDLYLKFISTLAFGLIGVGLVLTVLFETIFHEWDAINDIVRRIKRIYSGRNRQVELIRPEDILLETEKKNTPVLNTRLIDVRRRQINEMDAVEDRLSRVHPQSSRVFPQPPINPN